MKYIIKQRIVKFQYVVVEAANRSEAMKHTPMIGDEHVTDAGYFTNVQVKPYNTGDYVYCKKFHFVVVTRKNLFNTIRKMARKLGFKPYFVQINEEHLKSVHPTNPVYSKPK